MPSAAYLQAKQLYARGRLREAAGLLERSLQRAPEDADLLQLLGSIWFQMGRADEGTKLLEHATELNPGHVEAWNGLGLVRHLSGDNEAALEAFGRANSVAPLFGEAWMNRGFVLQELGRQSDSVASFQQALAVGYKNAQVYFFLGNAYAALGRHEEAIREFDNAISVAKRFGDAWNNRGNSLLSIGRIEDAASSIERAIQCDPKNLVAHANLASALHRLGRTDEALAMLADVIERSPTQTEPQEVRADILIELERLDAAVESLQQALIASPDNTRLRVRLMRSLQNQGFWHEAISLARTSTDPGVMALAAVTLPVILDSARTVDEVREHVKTSVAEVSGFVTDPLREVGKTTFFLAYHGIGERDLQVQVAEMYREISPRLRFEAGHSPGRGGRIRLGVLSAFLRNHTIGKLFAGLFERLDRERFEVVYLQIGASDEASQRFAGAVDRHVVLSSSLYDSMEQVAGEELDILLYPDIGMDVQSYYMAFSRLAPVQCVMWGHPMTTGSPTMDYFISSEHLEPADGEVEYSEKLIRLPSLTTYFRRPAVPPAYSLADFGLPEEARLYACLQSTFKFHPDFDRVLAQVLERDPKGRLLMLKPKHQHWEDLLVHRWRRTYPLVAERTLFLPGMSLDKYLGLSSICDAVLDPIQFGGGNSSLECLAVGAPVVTLPQTLLRNRITYSAYKQIGFLDLIAHDEAGYVDLTLRLATDKEWQRDIRRTVFERSGPLFENAAAVWELSEFLAKVRP